MKTTAAVLYWDTSAVLSALFRDEHSDEASAIARETRMHLMSTLAWAETHAVIARIHRERMLASVLIEAALEALESGPWRRVNVLPDWNVIQALAPAWPLRGADLWHLAAAKHLHAEIPELALFSFDARLTTAARGEGLAR